MSPARHLVESITQRLTCTVVKESSIFALKIVRSVLTDEYVRGNARSKGSNSTYQLSIELYCKLFFGILTKLVTLYVENRRRAVMVLSSLMRSTKPSVYIVDFSVYKCANWGAFFTLAGSALDPKTFAVDM